MTLILLAVLVLEWPDEMGLYYCKRETAKTKFKINKVSKILMFKVKLTLLFHLNYSYKV